METIEKLIGFCPACEKKATFYYIGTQKLSDKILKLYLCNKCESCRSLNTIEEYNPQGLKRI